MFPSRSETERTATREVHQAFEAFGGISEANRAKIERKEVSVLYGKLVEPEWWTSQGKVAPQEIADSIFEILGSVRDAIQNEGLQPELRLLEEGAFVAYFEIWSEGSGGFSAPMNAILAIRRALLRVNGLRKTDGHREIRVQMGLRTGLLVRDARSIPNRYVGVAVREAQELARAAGVLGVDCLIAPMGDPARGDPLAQLMSDFLLRPVAEGKFRSWDSSSGSMKMGERIPLHIIEGIRRSQESGETQEIPQTEGMYFEPVRSGDGHDSPGVFASSALFELDQDLLTRNNVIRIDRSRANSDPAPAETSTANESTPEKPDQKSEAS
jgi:hypothetical protein